MGKRELEIAGHTNPAAGIYVRYATITNAAYNLLRVVLAEIIANEYL
jgi:hypothetical protein